MINVFHTVCNCCTSPQLWSSPSLCSRLFKISLNWCPYWNNWLFSIYLNRRETFMSFFIYEDARFVITINIFLHSCRLSSFALEISIPTFSKVLHALLFLISIHSSFFHPLEFFLYIVLWPPTLFSHPSCSKTANLFFAEKAIVV